MKNTKIFAALRCFLLLALASVLLLAAAVPALATGATQIPAANNPEFTYELLLTDRNGLPVTKPRTLSEGDILNVEIRLARTGHSSSTYNSYGIEFRLLTRGLTYNYDGKTLRSGTEVRELKYSDGDSVGFAWYDLQQVGEATGNPVLAGQWSYTVSDPSKVNITVPVALIYVTGDKDVHVPVGSATLELDVNGGVLLDQDVSGTYKSGETVILPNAELGGFEFLGWDDGAKIYPPGTEYTVTGVVTLTARFQELERNRYLTLDPKGGKFVGEDPSGYYADGMELILPEATREGYVLKGWQEGETLYPAGSTYTVHNTVTLFAQWEPKPSETTPSATDPRPTEPTKPVDPVDPPVGERECLICGSDRWQPISFLPLCWLCLLILLIILLLIVLLIILLLLSRCVRYSLKTGDVALDYRNGETHAALDVILVKDGAEYQLAHTDRVRPKRHLRFLKNMEKLPIAQVETGIYKGKLILSDENGVTEKKCRIRVLDRDLQQKK